MPIPFIVKRAKGLCLKSTDKADFVSKLTHKFMMRKARAVWSHVGRHIEGKKILDVGMGAGATSFFLIKKGFEVTGVDVDNLSIYDDLEPVVYDGEKLPFEDNKFDTAIIVHVLHHCGDGIGVLEEAKRVAKRVIFIEDTFVNKVEWLSVELNDALTNFEFKLHKFRTNREWKKIIKDRGWKIVAEDNWYEIGVSSFYSRYCMFVVE